jgi:hypothetical protein
MKELKCVRRGQSEGANDDHAAPAVRFWLLTPEFWLLSPEIFFSKNEPKLCPSLLTIVKKRTQNEPKLKPNEPKKSHFLTPMRPFKPKIQAPQTHRTLKRRLFNSCWGARPPSGAVRRAPASNPSRKPTRFHFPPKLDFENTHGCYPGRTAGNRTFG